MDKKRNALKMILSFDEYQKFCEYMAENLRLKGYSILANPYCLML